MSTLPKFPYDVRLPGRNAWIPMYHYKRGPGGRYHQFRIVYRAEPELKKCKTEVFADYQKALARAKQVIEEQANRPPESMYLEAAHAGAYRRAMDKLSWEGIEVPIDQVATEWIAARKLAPDLVVACKDYARRHNGVERKTVGEAYEEFLKDRRASGCSKCYLSDLETRVGRFKKFNWLDQRGGLQAMEYLQIASINAGLVETFLGQLKGGGRDRNNFVRCLSIFFNFAKRRRYLPAEFDGFEALAQVNERPADPSFYRPLEMRALLDCANRQQILFLALGGFAGIRTAEILRLVWEDVDLESKRPYLVIGAKKAKTGARRVVYLSPNLQAWLDPLKGKSGKIVRISKPTLYRGLQGLCERVNVIWKPNALRHSYISYRLAQVRNMAKVAIDAGTSPKMIDGHYKELVTRAQADEWFALLPKKAVSLEAVLETIAQENDKQPVFDFTRSTRAPAPAAPAVIQLGSDRGRVENQTSCARAERTAGESGCNPPT